MVKCSEQTGNLRKQKRLVNITVVDDDGIHYGFGDIVSGAKVMLD